MPNAATGRFSMVDSFSEGLSVGSANHIELPGGLHIGTEDCVSAHVPGDTTTPAAPGAIWIGSGGA